MATISIGFQIVDKGNGLQALSVDAESLRKVMRANVEETKKLHKNLIDLASVTVIAENVGDAFEKVKGTVEELNNLQKSKVNTSQLLGGTGEDIDKITVGIRTLAEYFGKDYEEVLISVNSLSKGFGISAQEAFDKIRTGMASGADANGEFIDTLKEYPRYFKEAGLSADAFIAITANAAKQGIYSDKGVDTIKEANLRIREMTKATADALDAIGISSARVQKGLQDGSLTTFQVMQQVASKLAELPASSAKVGTAIADIFGGPGEDAGLEYIKSLATVELNLDAVKAATGGLAESQESQLRAQEKVNGVLSIFTDVLAGVASKTQPYLTFASTLLLTSTNAITLVSSLKAVNYQQMLLTARSKAGAATMAVLGLSGKSTAAVMRVFSATLKSGAFAATSLKIALKGLMIATGVGAVIVGVTTAIEALMGASEKVDDDLDKATKSIENLGKETSESEQALKNATNEIMSYKVKTENFNGTLGEEKALVGELNDKYGESIGYFKDLEGWKAALANVTDDYIEKLTLEAQAQMLLNKLVANNLRLKDLENTKGVGIASDPTSPAGKILQQYVDSEKKMVESTQETLKSDYNNLLENISKLRAKIKTGAKTPAGKQGKNTSKASSASTRAQDKPLPLGSLAWYENEASEIKKQISLAVDPESIKALNEGLQLVESQIDALNVEVNLITKWEDFVDKLKDQKFELDPIQLKVEVPDTDLKIDPETLTTRMSQAGQAVQDTIDKNIALKDTLSNTANVAGNLANAFSAIGDNSGSTEAKAAGIITQAIANMIASYAQMMASPATASLGPWGWVSFGAAGLAQLTATIGSLKALKATPFAKGGIVSGPTMALVGEYAGAKNNPEVIAPLNKLRDMIEPTQNDGGGKVVFKIDGRALVGILEKENKIRSRR